LTKSGSIWGALVRDARIRRCFFNAHEEKLFADEISICCNELKQQTFVVNDGR
jgi:hypothetical protein